MATRSRSHSRARHRFRAAVVAVAIALVVVPLVGVAPAGADTPWFRVAVPSPGDNGALTDVSCTTPTDCVAVGRYGGGPLPNKTLILRTVDGVSWSRIRSPNPGYENVLEAVSCVSATECTAVGTVRLPNDPGPLFDPDRRPLVLRTTNGTGWDWVPTDAYGEQSWLVDVSCTSAVRCRAVGPAGSPGPTTSSCARRTGPDGSASRFPRPRPGRRSRRSTAPATSAARPSATSARATGSSRWCSRPRMGGRGNGGQARIPSRAAHSARHSKMSAAPAPSAVPLDMPNPSGRPQSGLHPPDRHGLSWTVPQRHLTPLPGCRA